MVVAESKRGNYNSTAFDRLVDFVGANGVATKGHGLISGCCNPDYLLNTTDARAFSAAIAAYSIAVMHRYRGKIDRWDVVNEAFITRRDAYRCERTTTWRAESDKYIVIDRVTALVTRNTRITFETCNPALQ